MKHINEKFYLVRSDVLPETMKKTIEAKAMLERGKANSVREAVQKLDLSRSAYYKYKDAVFPFQAMIKEKIITLFIHLEDRAGTLSKLLELAAGAGCNLLTIHQTIPIQGKANVTMSLDISQVKDDIEKLIRSFRKLDFVEQVDMISSGA